MKILLIVIAGYLLGSINIAIAVSSRMSGGDVRNSGSGNAGATNMARVYGLRSAVLILLGDMAKAVASMAPGFYLAGDLGLCAGGIGCMLGHCFPVYHRFHGGKGVAVGAAVALMIDWRVFVCAVAVFLLLSFLTKKVSLGSCAAALAVGIAPWLFDAGTPRLVLAAFSAVLVIFQHRSNLVRLIKGTEPDFKAAKRE